MFRTLAVSVATLAGAVVLVVPAPTQADEVLPADSTPVTSGATTIRQNLAGRDRERIRAHLRAASRRHGWDRLVVTTEPHVAGAKVEFWRVAGQADYRKVGESVTGGRGKAVIRVRDRRPAARDTYVARVSRTDTTKADGTNHDSCR